MQRFVSTENIHRDIGLFKEKGEKPHGVDRAEIRRDLRW